MARWGVPGIAVGVLQDGELLTEGYGVESIETGLPLRPESLFRVGSVSKPFTATLVMTLVDDGLIELDRPVVHYYPDLRLADPEARETITMRHLLSHQSGLTCEIDVPLASYGTGDDALFRLVEDFPRLRQWYRPGELWAYSNSSFWLAGAVVAKVLGVPFEDAMRDRVFQPLGMGRSCFFAHEAIFYPAALGHWQVRPGSTEHRVARPYLFPRSRVPSGGVVSNTAELLEFAALHMTGGSLGQVRVLSAEAVEEMQMIQTAETTPLDQGDGWLLETAKQGVGWWMGEIEGRRIIGHGGTFGGFEADLEVLPDLGVALAILTNSGGLGHVSIRNIRAWLLDECCGVRYQDPTPIAHSGGPFAGYAGRYLQPDTGMVLTVSEAKEGLRGVVTHEYGTPDAFDELPVLYRPISDHAFVVRDDSERAGYSLVVIPDGTGKPRFVRFHGYIAEPLVDEGAAA